MVRDYVVGAFNNGICNINCDTSNIYLRDCFTLLVIDTAHGSDRIRGLLINGGTVNDIKCCNGNSSPENGTLFKWTLVHFETFRISEYRSRVQSVEKLRTSITPPDDKRVFRNPSKTTTMQEVTRK